MWILMISEVLIWLKQILDTVFYVWLQSCHALNKVNGNADMEVDINEVIWNNENYKYRNNVLFMRNCIENVITDMKDLLFELVLL